MRAIFTYHSVDPSGSPVSVHEKEFARHVDWFATGPVPIVPLAEIPAVAPSRDAIALTFDDGFANFADVAWPMLRARGLPVTLFVPTDRVGTTNRWGAAPEPGIPELPLLDWDALGRLAEEGLDIGAHSRTHADLSAVEGARLRDEIEGANEELERRLGVRPRAFAYPYGRVGPAALAAAREAYELACTTVLAVLTGEEDPHLLPRLDAFYYRAPGRIEAFGSTRFRLHLAARGTLRRVRASLGSRAPSRPAAQ